MDKNILSNLLKTKTCEEVASRLNVKKETIYENIRKYKVFEDTYFKEKNITSVKKHDLFIFYIISSEEYPDHFKNLKFLRIDTRGKRNQSVLVFRCNICGSEILKSKQNLIKFLKTKFYLKGCINCRRILEKKGKRFCSVCNKIKDPDDFYEKRSNGLSGICKECYDKKVSKGVLTGKRIKRILYLKKWECNRNNIEFDLVPEDLGISIKPGEVSRRGNPIMEVLSYPKECPVMGTKLDWGIKEKAGLVEDAPSLDRIDPSKGYVKGNVRIVSCKYNSIKNNSNPEERIRIAKYWLSNHGMM